MLGRKRVAREFEKLVKSEVKSEVCTEAGVSIESILKSVIYLTESQGFYCEFCETYIMNPIMVLAAPAVLYLPLFIRSFHTHLGGASVERTSHFTCLPQWLPL